MQCTRPCPLRAKSGLMQCNKDRLFDDLIGGHPGRARFAMKRRPIRSETLTNTIGIVELAACSAAAVAVECARITSGCKATSSFAIAEMDSALAAVKRYSMWTLRPSDHPRF